LKFNRTVRAGKSLKRANLKAFKILGRQFGYSLVGCELLGANVFFVRDDLLAGRFAEPFTPENLYEPHVIRCAIGGVIPQLFWIERVLSNKDHLRV
jgi:hypothetical protein